MTETQKAYRTNKQDDLLTPLIEKAESQMSTKNHDKMILDAVRWAKSLGYEVVEYHPGTEIGADAVFQNWRREKVILEVVSGASFKRLFQKQRIKEALIRTGRYTTPYVPAILGIIVVGDRIANVKKHALEAGLPDELFNPATQRVFPVVQRDFDMVIPVLLVSILGSRSVIK